MDMDHEKARVCIVPPQDSADWQRVQSEARPAVCDVAVTGLGQRRLQLIVCSAFEHEESLAGEIRQLNDEWWLFRSELVESWPNVQLIGYQPIPINPAVLSSFFERVGALSLPIAGCLDDMDGLDGEVVQLAVFGNMCSECRFQWWSGTQHHWKPLIDLTAEMCDVVALATRSSR